MKHLADIYEGLLDDDFDVEIDNAMVDFDKFKNLIDIKAPVDGVQRFTGEPCKFYNDDTIMANWAKVGRYIGSKNKIHRDQALQCGQDGNCLIGMRLYNKHATVVTVVYEGGTIQWFPSHNEDGEYVPTVTYAPLNRTWLPSIRDCQKIYSVAGFYFDKIKEIVKL